VTTLADALAKLADYVEPAEQVAALAANITTTTATTFTAAHSDDPIQIGTVVEIEDELLRVTGFASGSPNDTYTVVRGVNGSVAATHNAPALVAVNPKYPRFRRKRALQTVGNEWVSVKCPEVVTDATSFDFTSTAQVIAVPAGALDVLEVAYKVPGYVALQPLDHGYPRPYPTALVSTGRGVPLVNWPPAGYDVYLRYTRNWDLFTTLADADALPASWLFGVSMLAHGAAAELAGAKFGKRATFDSAHAQRDEDKAGQQQGLTKAMRDYHMEEFARLLDQYVGTWEGSQPVRYREP
jgi:hypothetical protein